MSTVSVYLVEPVAEKKNKVSEALYKLINVFAAKRRSAILKLISILQSISDLAFYHPAKCIISFVLAVAVLSIGFYYGTLECDIYKLYALSSSAALKRHSQITDVYPDRHISALSFITDDNIFERTATLANLADFEVFIKSKLLVPVLEASITNKIFHTMNFKSKIVERYITYVDVCEILDGRTDEDRSEYYDMGNRPPLLLTAQVYDRCTADSIMSIWPRRSLGRSIMTKLYPFIVNTRDASLINSDLVLVRPEISPIGESKTLVRIQGARGITTILYFDDSREHESMSFESALIDMVEELKATKSILAEDVAAPNKHPYAILDTYGVVTNASWLTDEEAAELRENLSTSDFLMGLEGMDIGVITPHSLARQINLSTSLDMQLLRDYAISISILIVYGIVATATRDVCKTKWWVGAAGAISAFLGYIGGAGFIYLLTVSHTATANAVPFLVMGIGMDDTFVMIHAYSMTYYMIPRSNDKDEVMRVSSQRCRVALADSALAITITTTTNIVTFTVGASSSYLAARNFCLLAIGGLIGGYIAALFFFWPLLCISSRREVAGKPSVPCSSMWIRCRLLFQKPNYTESQCQDLSSSSMNSVMTKLIRAQIDYTRIESQIRYAMITHMNGQSDRADITMPVNPNPRDEILALRNGYNELKFNKRWRSLLSWHREKAQVMETETYESLLSLKNQAKHRYESLMPPKGNKGRLSQYLVVRSIYGLLRFRIIWLLIVLGYMALSIWIVVYLWVYALGGYDKKHVVPLDYLQDLYTIKGYSLIHSVPGCLMISRKDDGLRSRSWDHPDIQELNASILQELASLDGTSSYVSPLDLFDTWLRSGPHYGEWDPTATPSDFEDIWQQGEYEVALAYFIDDVIVGKPLNKQVQWRYEGDSRNLQSVLIYYFNSYENGFYPTLKSYERFRSVVETYNEQTDIEAQEYNSLHPFFESDLQIRWQTLISMLSAVTGIFLVTFLLMEDEYMCNKFQLAVVTVVLLIDVAIFGLMHIWDLEMNMLTYILLVMSIGFGVDYTLHIAHQYNTNTSGTTLEKLAASMILIGTPLMNSFFSTMGACLPLISRSNDYIYGTFLKMMVIVLVTGIIYGFGLLPAMLALLDYKIPAVRPFADIIEDYRPTARLPSI